MAINYAAATYADFKTFVTNEAFKGSIYYSDAFVATDPPAIEYKFYVYAIDAGRQMLITLILMGSADQKPSTFSTDFPNAMQVTFPGGVSLT